MHICTDQVVRTGRMQPSIFESESISPSSARLSALSLPGNYTNSQLGRQDSSNNPLRSLLSATRARISPITEARKLRIYQSALLLVDQQKYKEAEASLRQVLAMDRQVPGAYPFTLEVKYNLAKAILIQKRYSEAEEMFMKVWKARKVVLGWEHPDTLQAAEGLIESAHQQDQWAKMEGLCREVLTGRLEVVPDDDGRFSIIEHCLAVAVQSQGRYEEAEEMYRRLLAAQRTIPGDEHPDILDIEEGLASTVYHQGRYEEAEEM